MKKKYSKILVTGGAGFIGSHLVDLLIKQGYKVAVVDVMKKKKGWLNARARYYRIDIKDPVLEKVFLKEKPEAVLHLAAHIEDRVSVREPVMNAEENIIGSLKVFEACKKFGVKRIVFASSGVVYGEQKKLPVTEKITPWPLTPYAISKLVVEHYLNFYHQSFGIQTTSLRLANVYGPRQDGKGDSGVLAIFSEQMLKGKNPVVNNDGKTARDYIFVGDVARAFVQAMESDFVGEVNIATGRETTTLEIFKTLKKLSKSSCKLVFNPNQQDLVKKISLSPKLAAQKFNWRSKILVRDGFAVTVNWFKSRI